MSNIIAAVDSHFIEDGYRVIKVVGLGYADVQEADQIAPHGIDSVPVRDMRAIYANTAVHGESVIMGYINPKQIAKVGELRLYATDSDGAVVNAIHFKNNGDIELGGTGDHLVRFKALEQGFNDLKNTLNALISKFNSHVHTGVTTGAGSSGTTITTQTSSTASIASAKIDKIKTA